MRLTLHSSIYIAIIYHLVSFKGEGEGFFKGGLRPLLDSPMVAFLLLDSPWCIILKVIFVVAIS